MLSAMLTTLGWSDRSALRSRFRFDLQRIQACIDRLNSASSHELKEHARQIQRTPVDTLNSDHCQQACALFSVALRRIHDVVLYEEQMLTALVLTQGGIAEMQTGEGKTFACAPAACWHALRGQGVHVVTTNEYLAQRDHELLEPVFAELGLRAGLNLPGSIEQKQMAYRADVTFGTAHEFGFDYLRDQLSLASDDVDQLGRGVLREYHSGHPARLQRGQVFAIVDEVDNVLLDDACAPLVLSSDEVSEAEDAEVHQLAKTVAVGLRREIDFEINATSQRVSLTSHGSEVIYDQQVPIPYDRLLRTWTEYVELALHARFSLQRDAHYVVDENEIRIVDGSTGRIFQDRTWSEGLHQAVEAKEGLRVTAERSQLAQITRQRYFRKYSHLAGMTGTARGCETEFRRVYGLDIVKIPLRRECQRDVLSTRYFANQESKWCAIVDSTLGLHAVGRPVLIGTRTIRDSEELAERLRTRHVDYQVLNGRQDAAEAEIVGRAGARGAITIATNLAGRGTDIPLTSDVRQRGGLHVIVSEPYPSQRIDRQLMGRAARQGDPGSAQIFVSAEDDLIQRYGAWLGRSLQQFADANGEVHSNLDHYLSRLQANAQRQAYSARQALLKRDQAREGYFVA